MRSTVCSTTGSGETGSTFTARIVRPPPHGLSRGKRALSRRRTRAPPRARWMAVTDPAGPAPTTTASKRCTTQGYNPLSGGVPERPKGAVCKTAGSAYGGSNPPAPTRLAGSREDRALTVGTPASRHPHITRACTARTFAQHLRPRVAILSQGGSSNALASGTRLFLSPLRGGRRVGRGREPERPRSRGPGDAAAARRGQLHQRLPLQPPCPGRSDRLPGRPRAVARPQLRRQCL